MELSKEQLTVIYQKLYSFAADHKNRSKDFNSLFADANDLLAALETIAEGKVYLVPGVKEGATDVGSAVIEIWEPRDIVQIKTQDIAFNGPAKIIVIRGDKS